MKKTTKWWRILPFLSFALIVNLQAEPTVLEEIVVIGKDLNTTMPYTDKYGGVTTINKKYLEKTPNSQGGLTQAVRTNPSVRYNRSQRTSLNGAEIEPDDVSIHGAPHWQNNFMIDGVNFNNDLNPRASRNTAFGKEFNSNAALPDIGSISQGLNLDPDLIDSVSLHSDSISAEYGNFQGGVIETKTKDPSREFSGKFSVKHTNDSWRYDHIDPLLKEDFESSTDETMQSDYSKWIYYLTLEGYLSDNFGLLFSGSRTRSKFTNINSAIGSTTVYWDPNLTRDEKKDSRKADNYLLKGIWHFNDRLTISPKFIYAPSSGSYYNSYSKNGNFELKSGGMIGSLDFDYDGDIINQKHIFSYSKQQSSKDSDAQFYRTHPVSDQYNWGRIWSNEGGYGDIDQKQTEYSYKGNFDFKEFDLGDTSHHVRFGVFAEHKKGEYEIPGYYSTGSAWIRALGAGQSCLPGDDLCYSGLTGVVNATYANGYWFNRKSYYQGYAKVDINDYTAWLEDEIKIGNLSIRPGIRLDYDNLSKQTTIAPRLTTALDIFDDDKSVVNLGLNRYYGRNVFAYSLRNGMISLGQTCTRTAPDQDFVCGDSELPRYEIADLDIPYTDEIAIGFKQKISNVVASARYVKRYGKDEIRSRRYLNYPVTNPNMNIYYYKYSNDGESESDSYEFRLASIEDFDILGSANSFEFTVGYTKTTRNYNSTDDFLDSDLRNENMDTYKYQSSKVVYNGNIIDKEDLPDYDFRDPFLIKLMTNTQFPSIGLGFTKLKTNWTNYFNYQAKNDLIYYSGEADTADYGTLKAYEKVELKNRISWDAKLGFEFSAPKNSVFFANLEIYNVLNDKVVAGKRRPYTRGPVYTLYEPGREFWLEVGYKW